MPNKKNVVSFDDLNKEEKKKPELEDMQKRIRKAKEAGIKEIEVFEKITEEYLNELEKLVLFNERIAVPLKELMKVSVERLIKPAVLGEDIPSLDERMYRVFRSELYHELFDKLDKENK